MPDTKKSYYPTWITSHETDLIRALTQSLCAQSAQSIFTSKHWLEACINTWPTSLKWKLLILRDTTNNTTGAALIGQATEVRHRILKSQCILFNQTGSPEFDEPYIEMNGFYGVNPNSFESFFDHLVEEVTSQPSWDELKVSGLLSKEADIVKRICDKHGLTTTITNRKPTYWIDLNLIRTEHKGDIFSSISSNTRQQIRRAIRSIEQNLGPIHIQKAASGKEAINWFESTAEWHRTRWQDTARRNYGGFDNDKFVDFHKTLIQRSYCYGVIEYLKITAGSKPFAYLYNFKFNNCTFFYLSGIDYSIGEKFKPGIVAQLMSIKNSIEDGATIYDFMAGENRYKQSLSTHKSEQLWLSVQRPKFKLKIERTARKLKNLLRSTQIVTSKSVK